MLPAHIDGALGCDFSRRRLLGGLVGGLLRRRGLFVLGMKKGDGQKQKDKCKKHGVWAKATAHRKLQKGKSAKSQFTAWHRISE